MLRQVDTVQKSWLGFEEILTLYGDAQPSTSQLAQDIDVPEPSLRLFCSEFLGDDTQSVRAAAATEHGPNSTAEARYPNGERWDDSKTARFF